MSYMRCHVVAIPALGLLSALALGCGGDDAEDTTGSGMVDAAVDAASDTAVDAAIDVPRSAPDVATPAPDVATSVDAVEVDAQPSADGGPLDAAPDVVVAPDLGTTVEPARDAGVDAAPPGSLAWRHRVSSKGETYMLDVAVLPASGEVALAGRFVGQLDYRGETLLTAGGPFDHDSFVTLLRPENGVVNRTFALDDGPDETLQWAIALDAHADKFAVTVDAYRSLRVAGRNVPAEPGDRLGFVVADRLGDVAFARLHPVYLPAVAFDPRDGSIVLAGSFGGDVTFEGKRLVAENGTEILVAKYDAEGKLAWVETWGGLLPCAATGVAVTPSGAIVVVGRFRGELELAQWHTADSVDYPSIFIMELDEKGKPTWSRKLGATANTEGMRVATNALGDIAIAGTFAGELVVSPQLLKSNGGNFDGFVTLLRPDGTGRWARRFGGPASDAITGVALTADGDVAITGRFTEAISFDTRVLDTSNEAEGFVAKLARTTGAVRWAEAVTAKDERSTPEAIAVDPSTGEIYIAGRLISAVEPPPGQDFPEPVGFVEKRTP